MKPSYYREKWSALKDSAINSKSLAYLSRQISHSFLDHYYQDDQFEQDYIDLICEMATAFPQIKLNSIVSTIFSASLSRNCATTMRISSSRPTIALCPR